MNDVKNSDNQDMHMTCECEKFYTKGCRITEKCIKDLWFFDNFNKKQMEALQRIGLRKLINKGAPIFMQGEPGDEMFFIKSGRIKLCKVHEDGSEAILDFRKAGDVIGENIFSGQKDYPLSAWAIEDAVTCGFNIHNFNNLVLIHPDIGLKVIQSMSAKIASMTDRLESMAENSLENRLYSVLSNLAKEHGAKVDEGYAIRFSLTHEELGFLVGAHRVSVTKAMRSLSCCGKVIKKDKKLILTNSFFK